MNTTVIGDTDNFPQPTFADVPYIPNGHARQKLDLYLPSSTDSSRRFPLIVYIHGGAFKFGSKRTKICPVYLVDKCTYAIASLDYRLSGDTIFPAAILDCKAAIRFLRKNAKKFNLSIDRIVVWGESAGGHCASMLGATSSLEWEIFKDMSSGTHEVSSAVQGVINYYGPSDFSKMDDQAPANSVMRHNDADSPESLYIGAQITTVPDIVAAANPITYIETSDESKNQEGKIPPFFIAHGTNDKIVPFGQSTILVEALSRKQIPVEFMPILEADHVFKGAKKEHLRELDARTERFLGSIFQE